MDLPDCDNAWVLGLHSSHIFRYIVPAMTIATRIAELRKPIEPQFRDDRWYYAGFSQYLKTEAFEHYNRDLADYYKASLKLVLEVLAKAERVMDEQIAVRDNIHVSFVEACNDAYAVTEAMRDLR